MLGHIDHILTQLVFSLLDTGSVNENILYLALGENSSYLCSCSLGFICYHCYLFTHKLIEKRGFSCICTPCNSNENRFCTHIYIHLSVYSHFLFYSENKPKCRCKPHSGQYPVNRLIRQQLCKYGKSFRL